MICFRIQPNQEKFIANGKYDGTQKQTQETVLNKASNGAQKNHEHRCWRISSQ